MTSAVRYIVTRLLNKELIVLLYLSPFLNTNAHSHHLTVCLVLREESLYSYLCPLILKINICTSKLRTIDNRLKMSHLVT